MHMYLATGGQKIKPQQLDPGEDIEVMLVSMEEFIKLVKENAFIQAMHTTLIYKALDKLGRLRIE